MLNSKQNLEIIRKMCKELYNERPLHYSMASNKSANLLNERQLNVRINSFLKEAKVLLKKNEKDTLKIIKDAANEPSLAQDLSKFLNKVLENFEDKYNDENLMSEKKRRFSSNEDKINSIKKYQKSSIRDEPDRLNEGQSSSFSNIISYEENDMEVEGESINNNSINEEIINLFVSAQASTPLQ